MGRIKTMKIDNFKSYLGSHTIGPFNSSFTAVIGPNGAGKSNLMDAISFVLGVHSKDLRGGVLQDLIYNMAGHKRPSGASVTIAFETEDESTELTDGILEFQRRITLSGSSTYSINGDKVSMKEYVAELERLGVIVSMKNFLVFQGDVASIANTSPAELTKFFEKVSGSDQFKPEYEDLKSQKSAAERELDDIVQKRKALSQEKRIIEKQKKEADEFARKTKEYASERQQLVLWKLNHARHRLKDAQEMVGQSTASRDELDERIEEHNKQISKVSKQLGKGKQSVLAATKKVTAHTKEQKSLRLKASKARKEQAQIKEELENDTRLMKKFEKRVDEQEVGCCFRCWCFLCGVGSRLILSSNLAGQTDHSSRPLGSQATRADSS